MIGWLKGDIRHRLQRGNRNQILLACAGVGYEIQLTERDWQQLATGQELELWIHQSISADNLQLFGFGLISERDLFRELISVSGVGPQAGIGLLSACGFNELVSALVQADIKTLCRAPGVGKRTAERLSLELRSKLIKTSAALTESLTEISGTQPQLISTLEALGYEAAEINRAIKLIRSRGTAAPDDDEETWLRESIRAMSEDGL